jgi:hypothetical protein
MPTVPRARAAKSRRGRATHRLGIARPVRRLWRAAPARNAATTYVACRSRLWRPRSYRIVVRGSECDAASWTSRSGTPASSAAVMNEWRRLGGEIRLVIPARRAKPLHGAVSGVATQPLPGGTDEDRSAGAFADIQVDRPGGARGEGNRHPLAALAHDGNVRWPRSTPRSSMSAPSASEIRTPFNANNATSA